MTVVEPRIKAVTGATAVLGPDDRPIHARPPDAGHGGGQALRGGPTVLVRGETEEDLLRRDLG